MNTIHRSLLQAALRELSKQATSHYYLDGTWDKIAFRCDICLQSLDALELHKGHNNDCIIEQLRTALDVKPSGTTTVFHRTGAEEIYLITDRGELQQRDVPDDIDAVVVVGEHTLTIDLLRQILTTADMTKARRLGAVPLVPPRRAAEPPKAAYPERDPAKVTLTTGGPVTPDHRDIDPATGLQKGYVVLSAEERAKGFLRPVRRTYLHATCGMITTMGPALAETYARDPKFYTGTYCSFCRGHFPVGEDGEFTWDGTNEKVGT
jgi:hypothetical protein